MNQGVTRNQKKKGNTNSKKSCAKPDNKGLRIKYLRNISLGGSDGPKNSDLFLSLKNADIRDNSIIIEKPQRNCHKGDQNIADDIDNIRHRRH